jgi:spectinomycin phosphotransferase
VITHGEPHPANLMSVHGRLLLIDWDTVGLACPERNLALVVGSEGEGVDRYQQATGREVDPTAITLYRLRWYLDDLASAVRLCRNDHGDTADTRRWWEGLAPRLAQLPTWLDAQT